MRIRQVLYTSRAITPLSEGDISRLLQNARAFNVINGITGILWTDGKRFMQALEGPPDSVQEALDRITNVPAHTGIQCFRDEIESEREFGYWDMAFRDELPSYSPFDKTMSRYLTEDHPARRYFLKDAA